MTKEVTAQTRAQTRALITVSLGPKPPAEAAARVSSELERLCYAEGARGDVFDADAYRQSYGALCNALQEPQLAAGGATLGRLLLIGLMTPQEAVDAAAGRAPPDPRRLSARQLAAVLRKHVKLAPRAPETAALIEKGCYNATIKRCLLSQDSYRRNWDSPMFLSIYATRIATVCENLDPDGPVARELGLTEMPAARELARGAWAPESLGKKTAAELCPEAGQKIRDRIRLRLDQKVEEKTSSLFPCPRCRKKRHTYRQVQIGAGDEPSTIMCTCLECGFNYAGHG